MYYILVGAGQRVQGGGDSIQCTTTAGSVSIVSM